MSEKFNPYHQWLGIPPKDQPTNYYRLLGVEIYESSSDVIASAADRQMKHIRSFQTGQRATYAQQLLTEISAAKVTLLNPAKKSAYDAFLLRLAEEDEKSAEAIPRPPKPVAEDPLGPTPVQRNPINQRRQPKDHTIAYAVFGLSVAISILTVVIGAGYAHYAGWFNFRYSSAPITLNQNVNVSGAGALDSLKGEGQPIDPIGDAPKVPNGPNLPGGPTKKLDPYNTDKSNFLVPRPQDKKDDETGSGGSSDPDAASVTGTMHVEIKGQGTIYLNGQQMPFEKSLQTSRFTKANNVTLRTGDIIVVEIEAQWVYRAMRLALVTPDGALLPFKKNDFRNVTPLEVAAIDKAAIAASNTPASGCRADDQSKGNWASLNLKDDTSEWFWGKEKSKLERLACLITDEMLVRAGVGGSAEPASGNEIVDDASQIITLEHSTFTALQEGAGSLWSSIPNSLVGAGIFEHIKRPRSDDNPKNGVQRFTLHQDRTVGLAASWAYDGNSGGGWQAEAKSKKDLISDGWQEAGEMLRNGKDKYTLFVRDCKAGDYQIRTRKYNAPFVFLPGYFQDSPPVKVDPAPTPAINVPKAKISKAEELIASDPIPDVLKNATGYFTGLSGATVFTVLKPTKVYVAASWGNDGSGGEWEKEIWQKEQFTENGWKEVGNVTILLGKKRDYPSKHTLFVRDCDTGEEIRIRTRKHNSPTVFVPADGS